MAQFNHTVMPSTNNIINDGKIMKPMRGQPLKAETIAMT